VSNACRLLKGLILVVPNSVEVNNLLDLKFTHETACVHSFTHSLR